jgi:hypothetical protein
MNSPDNFDQLRKLLAVKRYEQPPPGYFNSFAEKLTARIEAQSLAKPASWWRDCIAELLGKPLIASTYLFLFSGLLVVAIGLAQSSAGDDPQSSLAVGTSPNALIDYEQPQFSQAIAIQPKPDQTSAPSSISPVLDVQPASSPFALPALPFDHVSYQP